MRRNFLREISKRMQTHSPTGIRRLEVAPSAGIAFLSVVLLSIPGLSRQPTMSQRVAQRDLGEQQCQTRYPPFISSTGYQPGRHALVGVECVEAIRFEPAKKRDALHPENAES